MKTLILFSLFFLCASLSHAQIAIVKNGKPTGRIVVGQHCKTDQQAAGLFNYFIKKITGASLPIVSPDTKREKGDLIIETRDTQKSSGNFSGIEDDGFSFSSNDSTFRITGIKGSGTVYGAVDLLENYFGVRYFAAGACTYPSRHEMALPQRLTKTVNPSFRFRQTQAYSLAADTLFKIWHRLKNPGEIFAGNYWVHTFDRILPSAKYGKVHPEYFSFINGQRRPGAASQWCLSNPQVFEIVSKRVDSIFTANPNQKMISVSQNDGNFTNCSCDQCKAIDDEEGSPAGSIIRFMNKLAARFPDKEFSTLAYLFSVAPPKLVKPLPNVNIMLCDIDCYREVSLTENPSGMAFMKNMEGWAKISDNIFVWDYGINFDNYVSPFPNFHILQTNMQLFKKNHVNRHFSQIAGSKGGDFSELRSYVVAKLLWNVNCNVDSVIQSFLSGYYGAAAPYLYQYMKIQEGALLGSHIPLWIYDTPITHKNGMLSPSLISRYRRLFDEAEKAVAADSTFLKRVWQQRLSVQYAELEIARTGVMDDASKIKEELSLFKRRAALLGVTALNERNNTIDDYCNLYLQRNLSGSKKSLAYTAKIIYSLPPDKPYDKIADKALTDGLFGGATFNESWVGWVGKDGEFVIDLGEVKDIKTVEADFLHKLSAWILLPKSMTCYTSTDNVNYTLLGKQEIKEDRAAEVKYVTIGITTNQKTEARYIKIHIETLGLCPPWHYGVGYPAWFFTDEISVY
ncbi:MAG: DUF4838 domain-containing protein [Mariniphaga sp.]